MEEGRAVLRPFAPFAELKLSRTRLAVTDLNLAAPGVARKGEAWWGKKDSNLRSHKTADLQSAPFATRDTPPFNTVASPSAGNGDGEGHE